MMWRYYIIFAYFNIMDNILIVCDILAQLIPKDNALLGQIHDLCPLIVQYKTSLVMLVIAFIFFIILVVYFVVKNDGKKTIQATLVNIKTITHDTKIFTFDLPKGMNKLGLNIGEHLEIEALIDGKEVKRKYTPISRPDVIRNSFELLIKIYYKIEQFPKGGEMTQYIDKLKIGQQIKVTLPYGRFNYLGKSQVKVKELNGKVNRSKIEHIYMVGGGTGITPLYQIVQFITEAESQENRPKITLLFANRTQDDILVKDELQAFQKLNPKFKAHFSIDKSIKQGWNGFTGYINEQKINKTLENINKDKAFFVVCGPPILCNIVEKILVSTHKINPSQFYRF